MTTTGLIYTQPYVVWFAQKGFPAGQLGDMLRMVYEIKVNGLQYLSQEDLSLL